VAEATVAPGVPGEAPVSAGPARPRLASDKLSAMYGKFTAVKNVSLGFAPNKVHALIGPSGCGKSTFLRTLNRMHEMSEGGWITGRVLLDGEDVYASRVSAMQLRKRVGMVFQSPTPFPTMTIFGNVAAGLKVSGRARGSELHDTVQHALEQAGLWDEVKDRLHGSAMALSGGQQQRLCIARTIAPAPEVVLLDEPTSALDPQGTQRIEELLYQLKRDFTIVIVTHNMQQAARVSDTTSFFYLGTMVETGVTRQIFTAPREEQTEAYITGRFG
jgi:phosphate transport system ATP-binding protein